MPGRRGSMLTVIRTRALRYARAAGVPVALTANGVFKDGSERDRRCFFHMSVARNHDGYRARVELMDQLRSGDPAGSNGARSTESLRLPEVPHDRGLMTCRPVGFPALDEAVAEAREAFRAYV